MEQLQMIRSDLERIPILGYNPLSGDKRYRTHVDWDTVGIRAVSDNDVTTIARWVGSAKEASWLGSREERLTEVELKAWIDESFFACVLTLRHAAYESSTDAVAFATLAPVDGAEDSKAVELGRVVVAPRWRHHGFGTTLIRFMATAAHQRGARVHLRSNPDNAIMHRLLEALPCEPLPRPVVGHGEIWYLYGARPTGNPKLGQAVQGLRRARRLKQSDLAHYCRVNRATINAIEAGRKNASSSLIMELYRLLCRSDAERVTFLFASVNAPSPMLISDTDVLRDELASQQFQDLWVMTDTPMETLDNAFLEATREAVHANKQRWYFVPPGLGAQTAKFFTDELSSVDEDSVKANLRVYEAPAVLCQLRIEVRAPGVMNAQRVSIEGPQRHRIALAVDRAVAVTVTINQAVQRMARRPHEQGPEWRCIYPPTNGGQRESHAAP